MKGLKGIIAAYSPPFVLVYVVVSLFVRDLSSAQTIIFTVFATVSAILFISMMLIAGGSPWKMARMINEA